MKHIGKMKSSGREIYVNDSKYYCMIEEDYKIIKGLAEHQLVEIKEMHAAALAEATTVTSITSESEGCVGTDGISDSGLTECVGVVDNSNDILTGSAQEEVTTETHPNELSESTTTETNELSERTATETEN